MFKFGAFFNKDKNAIGNNMMKEIKVSLVSPLLISATLLLSACNDTIVNEFPKDANLTDKQLLGKNLFLDSNLSEPAGQSCASCHIPSAGFVDPDSEIPTSRGNDPIRFGSRNTPTAAYAAFIPAFHFDTTEGLYIGGQFVDGRAATLEEQAQQPFFNVLEMNNPDTETLIKKIRTSAYAGLFRRIYGNDALDNAELALDNIGDAIAQFERTDFFAPANSKFDAVLAGKARFTAQERRGLIIFDDENKGNCAACHPSTSSDENPPLFTDFTYDNLGVPSNANNPFLSLNSDLNPEGGNFRDQGLGSGDNAAVLVADLAAQSGKFRVPTLRNIAITAPYMHNGVFSTLKEVVDFYNTRDVEGGIGHNINPEIAENVNTDELGNLGLTDQEVLDLIAFLETLTDGFVRQ